MVKVGCDPELFVRSLVTKEPMSIIGKLGGTKDETLFISEKGHGVLEDNVTAEFNIPPALDSDAFVQDINHCIAYIAERANSFGCEVFDAASVIMPDSELENPMAWVFGCEPDYNAYTGEQNPRPNADNPALRSAGGHVHIGFKDFPTMEESAHVVRVMDIFLGLPSLFIDKDILRRKLYGKAGAFRWKEYGVEYRTLSNFWIFSDSLKRWVFDCTQAAVEWSKNNQTNTTGVFKKVQATINSGNLSEAEKLIKYFGVCHEGLGI